MIQLRRSQLILDVCPLPRDYQQILFCASYLPPQLSCSRSCRPSMLLEQSLSVMTINPSYCEVSKQKMMVLTQQWWRQFIIFLINTASYLTFAMMTTSFHRDAIDQFRLRCRTVMTLIIGPRPRVSIQNYYWPSRKTAVSVPWGVSCHFQELTESSHFAFRSSVFGSP